MISSDKTGSGTSKDSSTSQQDVRKIRKESLGSTPPKPGNVFKICVGSGRRSVVFTSAYLPVRPIATVGTSVCPILPTLPAGPSTAPDPPQPAKENRNPNIPQVCYNTYPSANYFPSEEDRARKFIQRRRERELEQVARQKAIEERRAKEAREREAKERERRESRREEKDPKERRERGRKERAERKRQILHGRVKYMLPIRKEREETIPEREERRAKERCERLKIAVCGSGEEEGRRRRRARANADGGPLCRLIYCL
ncbi:hypothetical protein GHT06_019006 [Daphnia sinensis]|uniref:Uncharacterized protein n=1 Tax=Daphnia sinensis TaxID=1820382 RepID=A0AAD5PQ65_9CRUS|nr:hypothetical protein GHT06_019006 [Daphnia sinensis]